jgi:hypothetical protein
LKHRLRYGACRSLQPLNVHEGLIFVNVAPLLVYLISRRRMKISASVVNRKAKTAR